MTEYIETVIIGGGQAGLALSYYLTQQGRTHLILEQGRAAETWRSGRWDSFTLNTPNWMIQLPGFPYQGDDPDGFLTRADVVACLEQYASSFHAPLQCGVRVTAVRQQPAGDGYLVEMEERTIKARNSQCRSLWRHMPDTHKCIPQSTAASFWRCPGGRHRPVRLSDCRGFARERAAGLSFHVQLWESATTLSRQGHHPLAQRDGFFRSNA